MTHREVTVRTTGVGRGLTEEIRELCTQKGWRENLPLEPRKTIAPYSEYVFGAYVALAMSELGEALDAYRDKVWSATCHAIEPGQEHMYGCSGRPHTHPKPVGVGPEVADVLIRLLDICDIWDIDINSELSRVLEYGWTREFKHGGRTL